LLALSALLTALASCESAPRAEPTPTTALERSIDAIANDLVESAKLRTDVRAVRALQRPIQPVKDPATPEIPGLVAQSAFPEGTEEHVGDLLSRELQLALSDRMHLIESVPSENATDLSGDLREVAFRSGATHLLVGEHNWDGRSRDGSVAVTVRLVDARSRVIIAAVRGDVPTSSLLRGLAPVKPVRKLIAVPDRQVTLPPVNRSAAPISSSTTESTEDPEPLSWRTKELADLLGIPPKK
jgi:hypothetical protein